MKPLAFVRTVTPPIFAVFRPTAAAAAAPEAELPPAGALLDALLGALLDELHAASAARPAAAAGTTSARRRRLGAFGLSCDVIMSFPFPPCSLPFSLALWRALPRAERR